MKHLTEIPLDPEMPGLAPNFRRYFSKMVPAGPYRCMLMDDGAVVVERRVPNDGYSFWAKIPADAKIFDLSTR